MSSVVTVITIIIIIRLTCISLIPSERQQWVILKFTINFKVVVINVAGFSKMVGHVNA